MPAEQETRVVDPQTGGEKGSKLARFDLLPWTSIWEVAEVFGRGSEKYAARNWERGYRWGLSLAALGRHLARFMSGEDLDPELGVKHMAQVAWHALVILEFMRTHPELDDRSQGGRT